MWTTPEDRRRAEFRARKLTKAQEAQRTHREQCFNAGFDAAARSVAQWPIDTNHPQWTDRRREAFQVWDEQQQFKESQQS